MRLLKNLRMPLGKLVLCIWLIASGAIYILEITNRGVGNVLALIAIAAGVLFLLDI